MSDPQEQAVAKDGRSGPESGERARWHEEKLYLALSSARMGSWDWNLLDHSMHWDDRMHSLFGLSPSAFSGRYEEFFEMIYAEDRQHTAEQFARAVETRGEYQGTFRVVWPSDGSIHAVRVRSKVCCDDHGQLMCM